MTEVFTAGQKVRASQVPVPYLLFADQSANVNLTTTVNTAMTGSSITFSTVSAAANVLVIGVWDVGVNTAANGNFTGTLQVDGVTAPESSVFMIDTANTRQTVSQAWCVTLSGSGSHTLALFGQISLAGSASCRGTQGGIKAIILDF